MCGCVHVDSRCGQMVVCMVKYVGVMSLGLYGWFRCYDVLVWIAFFGVKIRYVTL